MTRRPKLNFPPYRFKVSAIDGVVNIWDGLRRRWLVLTEEEWVRQHLLRYLTEECRVPPANIKQECPVCIQGMNQRADAVVYGNDATPLLLAECKSHDTGITASVYAQAVRYNTVIKARYIMITNGLQHYIYERCAEEYRRLDDFPVLFQF